MLKGIILHDIKISQLYTIFKGINFALLMKAIYIYTRKCQLYTIHCFPKPTLEATKKAKNFQYKHKSCANYENYM